MARCAGRAPKLRGTSVEVIEFVALFVPPASRGRRHPSALSPSSFVPTTLRPVTSGASGLFSLSSRHRREERAGERRSYSSGWPLSPTLSPFVPHGEREKKETFELLVTGQGARRAGEEVFLRCLAAAAMLFLASTSFAAEPPPLPPVTSVSGSPRLPGKF